MSNFKFSDGVNIDTSGPFRKIKLEDGWYVVGGGKLIPCKNEEEADTEVSTQKILNSKNPKEEFLREIGRMLM